MKEVTIYTDGGCDGNPGPGGWAAILVYGKSKKEISGGELATTNNRMEIKAAAAAIALLKEPCAVTLYTDSEYLRRGITEWLPNWKRRGWKTIQKKKVKNQDLWQELDAISQGHKINWQWLKGHAGHSKNERCDALAAEVIRKIKSNSTASQLKLELQKFREKSACETPEPKLL